jgi:hypothetical protein
MNIPTNYVCCNFKNNATDRTFIKGDYVIFVDEKKMTVIKSVLPHDGYMVEDEEEMT